MNNIKFYSEKSKANRALKNIGEGALAAAQELLFQGDDGRWGFSKDAAERAQYRAIAEKSGISVLLLPKDLPPSTGTTHSTIVRNGKRMETGKRPPSDEPRPAREHRKGYNIEKGLEVSNGVRMRSKGTLCRAVWDALDAEPTKACAARVKELAAQHGWNINNALCEFYTWRKFHGISGRQPVR